ncbi:hypothetical protein FKM82_021249 [Ascaphus truei]
MWAPLLKEGQNMDGCLRLVCLVLVRKLNCSSKSILLDSSNCCSQSKSSKSCITPSSLKEGLSCVSLGGLSVIPSASIRLTVLDIKNFFKDNFLTYF